MGQARSEYYQIRLDQVSRSFAFCIKELEEPLREWVGLSYLLCRLVDTVEDAIWDSKAEQLAAFQKFQKFLQEPAPKIELDNWAATFPSTIPESEKELLAASHVFFSDLHSLDKKTKNILQVSINDMCRGMNHFCLHRKAGKRFKLLNLAETNQYCFFVAGVVGELLTKLVSMTASDFKATPQVLLNAFHFGFYLQKVNLLKDQHADEEEGRFFVSSRSELLKSLEQNARFAMSYLKAIPKSSKGYRVFCAWSLFLGLSSLPYIQESYKAKNNKKISRKEAFKLLAKVKFFINDNHALEKLFHQYVGDVKDELNSDVSIKEFWCKDLHDGSMSLDDMKRLGMVPRVISN